jgi:membrane-associated phospholipid phosphatase
VSGRVLFDARARVSALDTRVLDWLRKRHSPRLTRAVRAVTEVGSLSGIASVASIVTVVLWMRDERRSALLVASSAAGAGALSEALKRVFLRQRPDLALRRAKTVGFAFPSGHSAASAATYGALALLLAGRGHRFWGRLIGTLVPASVGASRVYLSVHFPSDVVVGWALGAAWLSVVRRLVACKNGAP